MTKVTKFDKPTLRALRPELNAALAAVGAKHGISITIGNGSYTGENATFKLELALLGSDGKAESKELVALKECYPELVNKQVTLNRGSTGRIIGYNPRAHQYPFLVKTVQGVYKISALQAGLPGLC